MSNTSSITENCQFYVGENSSMEGAEMTISGTARIDGRLTGKIYADHLIVGKSGYLSGEISGESAEISGTLEQSITLKKKLKVMSTGRVNGRVAYGSIDIDEGATVTGELQVNADGAGAERSGNEARLSVVASALSDTSDAEPGSPDSDTDYNPAASED